MISLCFDYCGLLACLLACVKHIVRRFGRAERETNKVFLLEGRSGMLEFPYVILTRCLFVAVERG